MKKLSISFLILGSIIVLSSCSSSNADAEAFCACVANPTDECEQEMEKLESDFKSGDKDYEAFAKAARETCPDEEKWIERMK